MTALGALAACALATWLLRIGFIAVLPAHRLPDGVRRALRHVGPSALGALVVTALVAAAGPQAMVTFSAEHLALLAAALVAWRVRNLAAPMLVAMLVLVVVEALT